MLLRRALLYLSRHPDFGQFLSRYPQVRRAADNLIAGFTRFEALRKAEDLTAEGFGVIFTYLGENWEDPALAEAAASEYRQLLEDLDRGELRGSVAVRLSQFGLGRDPQQAGKILMELCELAGRSGRLVRVDMERAALADAAQQAVRRAYLRFPNLAITIQASLRRSSQYLEEILRAKMPVRLVKGSYLERAKEVYRSEEEVELQFMRLVEALMREGNQPVIATHDPKLTEFAEDMAFIFGREHGDYEFELLYGLGGELAKALRQAGQKVRIYLPYGDQWYPYVMRRLAERPSLLWPLLRHLPL